MTKRIALILTSGALIAACGSSSNKDPSSSRDGAKGYAQALAFSKCMRAHGLPDFPDPTSHGNGIQLSLNPSSGVNPKSPAFQSAQSACKRLLPGGGPDSGPPSAQAKAEMLKVSQCMRAHGIAGFPDPTTSQPSRGGNFGLAIGRNGVFLAIPRSIDVNSPAFKQAAAACNFGPKGGGPPSTSQAP